MNDDELTPSEKEAMETLPKERMPSAGLEERIVKSLRANGVLQRQQRPAARRSVLRTAGLIAASVVLVVGGFGLGRWTGQQQTPYLDSSVIEADDASLAASLQEAGSAYVIALDNFVTGSDSTAGNDEVRQGREVALKTLYMATNRVSRMVPKEHLAGQLLQVIDVKGSADRETKIAPSNGKVIWF